MAAELNAETVEMLENTRDEMLDYCDTMVRAGNDKDGLHARIIKDHAEKGHAGAQESCNDFAIPFSDPDEPAANAELKRQFESDELADGEEQSPYDRPWLFGGADPPHLEGQGGSTPYDETPEVNSKVFDTPDDENRRVHDGTFESWQGDDGPAANAEDDDEPDGDGPKTAGTFADFTEKEGDR